jgi:hypothetical protein
MSDVPVAERMNCPYLGKLDDRNSVYNQPTRRHRCYRWEQALPIRRQDQEQYCLSPLHVTCPRLSDPNALPVPETRRRTPHRSSVRILGMPVPRFLAYIVPMVLLFIAAITASYLLVQRMTAPPLPIAFVPTMPGTPSATETATPTPFPTWTPVPLAVPILTVAPVETPTEAPIFVSPIETPTPEGMETPTETSTFEVMATSDSGLSYTPEPTEPPVVYYTPEANAVGTSTFESPFESPLETPVATEAGATPAPTEGVASAGPAPFNFMAIQPPVKTLEPGGVDVCAKVYGRVFDMAGNNITKQVAVSATWWPDNGLVVGAPGSPPINADGTYEFCLSRGQFNIAVVAHKKTSEQFWIDTDEPDFTGKVIIELNFKEVR